MENRLRETVVEDRNRKSEVMDKINKMLWTVLLAVIASSAAAEWVGVVRTEANVRIPVKMTGDSGGT